MTNNELLNQEVDIRPELKDFLKYPSLRLPFVGNFARLPEDIASSLWYGAEKLNGMNVSIVKYRNAQSSFKLFSRKDVLTQNRHKLPMNEILENGLDKVISDYLSTTNYERLHVYGELFGAGIMNMNYDLNLEKEKDFRVFGALAYKGNGLYDVLGLETLQKYFSDYLVPIEGVGNLYDMLRLNKDKNSNFGGDREGYVLLPVVACEYNTNLPTPFFNGFKVKYGKYAEKSKTRVKVARTMDIESTELLDSILEYVTPARVLNVVSHTGIELDRKNIGKIMPDVREDLMNEYVLDKAISVDEFKTFDKAVLKMVDRFISTTINETITQETV